jgi:hypothetical protein
MSSRRLLEGALALIALAIAALLIVFARGVDSVQREVASLTSSSARIALVRDPGQPEFGAADRLARRALGAQDDLEFARALGLVEDSRRLERPPNEVLELHAEAIVLLQRLDGGSRQRASQAAAMSGALYVEDAVLDPDAASRYRQQAAEAFQRAIRLDPTNEAAKLGLELILIGTSATTTRIGEEGAGGGITGAGETVPGTGY